MPIWPTHNHELLPDTSSLLAIMLITNLNSWMILFAEVLGSEYAAIATLAPTLVLVWGFSIRIESASSFFYWAQYVVALSHVCTQSRRAGVLLSLSINVYYFLLLIYIPLLLNFFRGAFRSADLGPTHRFLMENVVAMLWIYHEVIAAAVRGEQGQSDDGLIMTLATIVLLEDNHVIMGEVAVWQTFGSSTTYVMFKIGSENIQITKTASPREQKQHMRSLLVLGSGNRLKALAAQKSVNVITNVSTRPRSSDNAPENRTEEGESIGLAAIL